MGPPKKESPFWVAKRDNNHGEKTKDKAISDAGNQERASRTTWSSFWYGIRRDQEGSSQERQPIKVGVH